MIVAVVAFVVFGVMALAGLVDLHKLNGRQTCWHCKRVLELDDEYGQYCVHCGELQTF